jgi:hypothetical protein
MSSATFWLLIGRQLSHQMFLSVYYSPYSNDVKAVALFRQTQAIARWFAALLSFCLYIVASSFNLEMRYID